MEIEVKPIPSNVFDINKNKPHNVDLVKCNVCGHEWLAVYPTETDINKLQCSVCLYLDSGEAPRNSEWKAKGILPP